MSDLTHLFKVEQKVKCRFLTIFYDGTVTKTYADHIIVNVPGISDYCYFEGSCISRIQLLNRKGEII